MDMSRVVPNGIWFWKQGNYQVVIALVNDLYRFDVYDRITGKMDHRDSGQTLAESKRMAFDYLATV